MYALTGMVYLFINLPLIVYGGFTKAAFLFSLVFVVTIIGNVVGAGMEFIGGEDFLHLIVIFLGLYLAFMSISIRFPSDLSRRVLEFSAPFGALGVCSLLLLLIGVDPFSSAGYHEIWYRVFALFGLTASFMVILAVALAIVDLVIRVAKSLL